MLLFALLCFASPLASSDRSTPALLRPLRTRASRSEEHDARDHEALLSRRAVDAWGLLRDRIAEACLRTLQHTSGRVERVISSSAEHPCSAKVRRVETPSITKIPLRAIDSGDPSCLPQPRDRDCSFRGCCLPRIASTLDRTPRSMRLHPACPTSAGTVWLAQRGRQQSGEPAHCGSEPIDRGAWMSARRSASTALDDICRHSGTSQSHAMHCA